jgi:hypothetical protein
METGIPSAIPEIAIAITGFSAVATVLVSRDGYRWDPSDRMRMWVLVRTSIIALFASFVPMLAGQVLESIELAWSISCGILAFVVLADVTWTFSRPNMPPNTGHRLLGLLTIVLILALFASAFGDLGAKRFLFLFTLLFLLAVALYNFIELLMLRVVRADG